MKFYLLLPLYLLLTQNSFASVASCELAEKKFQSRFEKIEVEYQKYSKETFIKDNKPYWKTNKSVNSNGKIAYLMHGFIGSPYEMKPIANLLYDAGFTVVNDLLPGHGVNGSISNHYDSTQWKNHVNESIELLKSCSANISLIGFSTGGLLIHDYISSNPEFKPDAVVLYSPFYKAHLAFLAWVKDIAAWVTPTVAVVPLYMVSRYQDIQVAVKDKEHYMQNIPLTTSTVIQKLGTEVYNKSDITSDIPVLLFVSENDQVLNDEVTISKLKKDFKNLKMTLFEKKRKVPHHLMVDSVSSVAGQVQKEGAEFIQQNAFTSQKLNK